MSALGKKLRQLDHGMVAFHCPGCNMRHAIRVEGQRRPKWQLNGNGDAPTFAPSVLVQWPDPDKPGGEMARCHSFVTDGKIRFLNDCTHDLAGQTVDLPDLDHDGEVAG